jgi:hypothetical protein
MFLKRLLSLLTLSATLAPLSLWNTVTGLQCAATYAEHGPTGPELLRREGATPKVSGYFYKAIFQSVLLFGSET